MVSNIPRNEQDRDVHINSLIILLRRVLIPLFICHRYSSILFWKA